MKRFLALALAALAVGLGAGGAHAQKVASLYMAGLDPRSGNAPKQVVILFHGFSQRGVAMKSVADTLARRLPDAAFIFPDGPISAAPGKSWYVNRGDESGASRDAARQLAIDTVKKVSEGLKVPHENIVVVGFSQGGGVALEAGSCVTPDVRAIVSIAGVLTKDGCKKEATGKPADVLIVFNEFDPAVKMPRMKQFQDQAIQNGYDARLEVFSGTEHWPAPEGIIRTVDYIVDLFGGKPREHAD